MMEYLDKAGDAFCNDLDSDFSKLTESVNSLSELDHSAATWEQKSKELCKSMFIPFSPEVEAGQKFFESEELCEKLVKAFDEIWKKQQNAESSESPKSVSSFSHARTKLAYTNAVSILPYNLFLAKQKQRLLGNCFNDVMIENWNQPEIYCEQSLPSKFDFSLWTNQQ